MLNKNTKPIFYIVTFCIFYFMIDSICFSNLKTKHEKAFDKIDIVMYINLKHRLDRKKSIEKQLSLMNVDKDKIIRIDAIKDNPGDIGCAKSHIKSLELAQELGHEYTLVLEDDFIWKYNPNLINPIINNIFKIKNWDVCLLSCNNRNKNHKSEILNQNFITYNKVFKCLTTSSYIIKRHYIPVLLNFWKKKLNEKPFRPIDRTWFELQQKDNWIMTNPLVGKQLDSYSDIEEKEVSYNV